MLEAIAATPSPHELTLERGDVETDTALQQDIDVLYQRLADVTEKAFARLRNANIIG